MVRNPHFTLFKHSQEDMPGTTPSFQEFNTLAKQVALEALTAADPVSQHLSVTHPSGRRVENIWDLLLTPLAKAEYRQDGGEAHLKIWPQET